MHNINEETQRCPQRYTSHHIQNPSSLRNTRNSTTYMVIEGSLLLNFTPRMSRLGLVRMKTTDKTKSPWGEFTVLDLLTLTPQCCYDSYHLSVLAPLLNPSQIPDKGGSNSRSNRYRMNRRGPNTLPCGMHA